MNEAELIRRAMSALGKRTSERKKLSSRKNAKRPRKKKSREELKADLREGLKGCSALKVTPIPIAEVYIDPTQFPKA